MVLKRLLPEKKFPPYAFTPGSHSHPEKSGGHMEGEKVLASKPLDPKDIYSSKEFLYSLDLYNFGYYWESHVYLEALWNASQRKGPVADFLKALIKLCAAGVKVKTKEENSVKGHAQRARELFMQLGREVHDNHFAGFSLLNLISQAEDIMENSRDYVENSKLEGPVFPFPIYPH
jgi:predicted metal-dependent hydrolase